MSRVYTLLEGTNTTASTATVALDKLGRATNYDPVSSFTNKAVYENKTAPRESPETVIFSYSPLAKGTNVLPSNVDAPADMVKNCKFDRGTETYCIFLEETESTDATYRRLYPITWQTIVTIPNFNGVTESIMAEIESRVASFLRNDAGVSEILRRFSGKIVMDAD